MAKVSRTTAENVQDFGVAEDRTHDRRRLHHRLHDDPRGPRPRPGARRSAGRAVRVPALGLRHQGPARVHLRRPRRGLRGRRRLLHAARATPPPRTPTPSSSCSAPPTCSQRPRPPSPRRCKEPEAGWVAATELGGTSCSRAGDIETVSGIRGSGSRSGSRRPTPTRWLPCAGMPPASLSMRAEVQQVPRHERGVAVGEVVLGAARAGVEVATGRARPRRSTRRRPAAGST